MDFPSSDRDPAMPICGVCGEPMKLKDMRAKLAKYMGLTYSQSDEAAYEIVCCGYVLRMENSERRQEAVHLLRSYHQTHRPGDQ